MSQNVRFEITAAVSDIVAKLGNVGDSFRKLFAEATKGTKGLGDALEGMSVDDVRNKIAQLNVEIGKLSNRDDIKKKQLEIEQLNAKLNEMLGTAQEASSGGGGGGIFGQVFGGTALGMVASKGLEMAAGALGSVKSAMIDGNAEMETYTTQFSTLLGSTEAAKERLAELAKFGAETPFEMPEVARAEKVLVGFGLTGKKALELTGKSASEFRTVVGDIAAGTGASFEEIALNMGKMSAGATGEAISRFQEMGIATREQLAAMGVEFAKSGELVSPLPVAMQAITKIAEEKFGGGMANLSSTFGGMVSTMEDTLAEMGRTIGGPIFERLKAGLDSTLTVLGSPEVQGGIKSFAEAIGAVVGFIINNIGKIAALGGIIGGIAIATKVGTVAMAAYNTVMMVRAALTGSVTAADIASTVATTGSTAATGAASAALGIKVVALTAAKVATRAWKAALMANPIILIATAIIGLGALIYGLVSAMGADTEASLEEAKARREQIAAEQELNKELRASTEAERDALQTKVDLVARYEQLGAMTTRTKEQEAEYQSVLAKLAETYPEAVSQTSTFAENLSRLREHTAGSTEELAALNTKLDELKLKELRLPIDAAAANFNVAIQSMRNDIDELADTTDDTDAFISSFQQQMAMATDASQIGEAKVRALSDAYRQFGSSNPELYKKLADSISGAAKAQQEWIDKSADMSYATSEIGKSTAAFLKSEQDLVAKAEKSNKQYIAALKARLAEIKGTTAEEIRARGDLSKAIQTATEEEIAAEKKAAEAKKAADEKAKKAAEEARKKRDEAYKAELANLKREEEKAVLEAQLERKSKAEIEQIQSGYQSRRLASAKKWQQDKETIASAEHEIDKTALSRQLALQSDADALEKKRREDANKDALEAIAREGEIAEQRLAQQRRMIESDLALQALTGGMDPIEQKQAEAVAARQLADVEIDAMRRKLETMRLVTEEEIRQLELKKLSAKTETELYEISKTIADKKDALQRAQADAQIAIANKEEDRNRAYAKSQYEIIEERRRNFEDGYARPVAQLATDVLKSFLDAEMTGLEREKLVWDGLKNMAIGALEQILQQALTSAAMSLATMLGLVPAQAAVAAATAAAWAPAAAMASLGSFGANAAPAAAAITSTTALAQLLAKIPALDSGGITTGPTIALIGERRKEAVAPLEELPGILAASMRLQREPVSIYSRSRNRDKGFSANVNIGLGTFRQADKRVAFRRGRGAW